MVGREDVVEDEPLGVEVARLDHHAAARGAQAGAAVGDHRELHRTLVRRPTTSGFAISTSMPSRLSCQSRPSSSGSNRTLPILDVAERVVLDDLQRRLVAAGADQRRLDRRRRARRVDRRALELGDREVVERAGARVAGGSQPARNSATVPLTSTRLPTATAGRVLVEDEDALDRRVVGLRLVVLHVEAGAAHRGHHAGTLEDDVVLVGREVRGGLDVVDAQARDAGGREARRVVLARVGRVVGVVVAVAVALDGDPAARAHGQVGLRVEHVGARGLAGDAERHGGAAAGERRRRPSPSRARRRSPSTFVPRSTSDALAAGSVLSTSGPSSPGVVGSVISKFSGFPALGPEVRRVVVRVLRAAGALERLVAVGAGRRDPRALVARALRRADAVEPTPLRTSRMPAKLLAAEVR